MIFHELSYSKTDETQYPPPPPIPGGGIPRPIIPGGGGGGMPIPDGAMPPTPCTGAAPSPIGATPGGGTPKPILGGGTFPLPTPRATPGPPAVTLALAFGGGGPSTAMLTTFSTLKIINPRERFSTRSSRIAARFLLRVRNSSASTRTRLRCLSNARKVPTMVRLSTREMRRRCSMYLNSLDPLPDGILLHAMSGV